MSLPVTYTMLDPTHNFTALVETAVPDSLRLQTAKAIMLKEPSCEQVGFLGTSRAATLALHMAGGEFCGNATMSAAVLYAHTHAFENGSLTIQTDDTGHIPVTVKALSEGQYQATVAMPSPISVSTERFSNGEQFPVMRFQGIAHVVLQDMVLQSQAEALAPVWCRFLKVPAIGLLFWSGETNTLKPFVYVEEGNTFCWENSCASGTTALGAYLSHASPLPFNCSIHQPGGTLSLTISPDRTYSLTGMVRVLKTESITIE